MKISRGSSGVLRKASEACSLGRSCIPFKIAVQLSTNMSNASFRSTMPLLILCCIRLCMAYQLRLTGMHYRQICTYLLSCMIIKRRYGMATSDPTCTLVYRTTGESETVRSVMVSKKTGSEVASRAVSHLRKRVDSSVPKRLLGLSCD